MPSPLGLVDYKTPYSNSDFGSMPKSHDYNSGKYDSLLNKGNKFYYRPLSESNRATVSQKDKIYGISNDDSINDIHNISTNSIISYCQQPAYKSMYLTSVDFAYLRDIGVYPNNRLVICRRFGSPIYNDLTITSMEPISTLIGWYNDTFPVKIGFGEEWENIEGDFVETLEEMFNIKGKITGGIGATTEMASNAVPLPGFAKGLQFQMLKELGLSDADLDNLPEGNPNIINEARIRKIGGGGLNSKISVDFETTYEQKFINNIDPEIMFLDIIGNALRFGTSKSEFIITGKATGKIREFFNKFASGDWVGALTVVLEVVISAGKKIVEKLRNGISNTVDTVVNGDGIGAAFGDIGKLLAGPVLSKFRIKMGGVIASMSGEPSTPWHVTVGNPKKPAFSSGDMLVSNVNVDFGPTLSFNDLPSTIIVKFTMEGARNYGMQEIFEKFNNGTGRSYESLPTNYDTQISGNMHTPNNKDSNEAKLTNDKVKEMADNGSDTSGLSTVDKKRVENASNVKDMVSTDNGKTFIPNGTVPSQDNTRVVIPPVNTNNLSS